MDPSLVLYEAFRLPVNFRQRCHHIYDPLRSARQVEADSQPDFAGNEFVGDCKLIGMAHVSISGSQGHRRFVWGQG